MAIWDLQRVSPFIVVLSLWLTHPWVRSASRPFGVSGGLSPSLSSSISAQLIYEQGAPNGHLGSLKGFPFIIIFGVRSTHPWVRSTKWLCGVPRGFFPSLSEYSEVFKLWRS